jgi:hypothetical protein
MIQIAQGPDGPRLIVEVPANGLPVYLDNWAIINLAKHEPSRRRRFIDAVHAGAELLFSFANVVQLTGPKERSFDLVKRFLDDLGPHWVPIGLTPFTVMEPNGLTSAETCVSPDLIEAYYRNRIACSSGKIISLDADFFCLGSVLDWVANSDVLPKRSAEFDELLRTVRDRREAYKRNPFLAQSFDPSKAASFAWFNLTKILIVESKSHQVKKGDGIDFCHAVMGSAFAKFATLDTTWKRRVEALPKPNRLARIYDPSQLDQMVTDIELALNQRRVVPGSRGVSHS